MNRDDIVSLVRSVSAGSTEDARVSAILDQIEEALPHGGACDLIFQDMRNLTPEQVVDEAIQRQQAYIRAAGHD